MKSNNFSFFFFSLLAVFLIVFYLFKNGLLAPLVNRRTLQKKNTLVDIEFKGKEYHLDFTKEYGQGAVEIAAFEPEEKWEGDTFSLREDMSLKNTFSLNLILQKNKKSTIALPKQVDLSTVNIIKIFVNTSKDNVNDVTMRLEDNDNACEYTIASLRSGWNLYSIKKDRFCGRNSELDWKNIRKITLSASGEAETEVFYDRLWAEKDEDYKSDLIALNPDIITLKMVGDKTFINFIPYGTSIALVKKITSVKDFTYTAKITPNSKGTFGINGRAHLENETGYFLEFAGIDSNIWRLYKIGKPAKGNTITVLDEGIISNFRVEKNKPLWLRLSFSHSLISAYISMDGTNFSQITQKKDNELKNGGIGIQSYSSLLLDKIDFSQ